MYDIIGDIHGHADKLEALLEKLGYEIKDGVYTHPTRKAFFLGDFIDRGPKIKRTLEIVKSMVDAGTAKTVMANHEFNLICYFNKDNDGNYLREHSDKNTKQIKETLEQLTEEEVKYYLDWFLTLPLWYEDENFRAVHACWDAPKIELLKLNGVDPTITINFLKNEYYPTSFFHKCLENILKGPEQELHRKSFKDKDGNVRNMVRVAWWSKETLIAGASEIRDQLSVKDITHPFYPSDEKLVFFGHYWLPYQQGAYITAPNAQCLDFSVAKGGLLVAYRFDGEKEIDPEKFEAV